MRHIALLKSNATSAGGLEKYASRIASAFAQRGDRVSILTTGLPKKSDPPITFYATETIQWPAFLRMEQFDRYVQKWIAKEKPYLVFGMDRNRFQTHIRAGNGVHIAYLKSRIFTEGRLKHWSCLLNPMHRKILQLEKQGFENPLLQKLFTNSHRVKREVLEHYRVDPNKIEVIHNGVEWKEMESHFLNWEEIKGCSREKFEFLFIGNGYLRKGLFSLLNALSLLKEKDFHLSVVGKENRIDQYRKEVDRLHLRDQVTFFGPQRDTRPFYQKADALVIPSFYDPFANVTVEALAMGLFVVSSKYNGGSEILTKNHGTIIEDLFDPESIASSLQTAMLHPKTRQSSEAARKSVESLDFSKQLDQMMKSCE